MAKIVFTASIMDLCHKGHLNLLKEMRKSGDKVIVILHTDASCYRIKGKIPIQHLETRMKNLEITGLVDEIHTTDEDDPYKAFHQICKRQDDVLFMRGNDNPNYPGKWWITENNIPTKFINYTEGISSTSIREKLWKFFS
jgi:D-beta-D-heptose 7-phosphate kinase/D-beta-D-heptose 1-phosphate adenosyltransferase